MALNKTEIEVQCKGNVTANKLPEWVNEPSVNESMSLGCIRFALLLDWLVMGLVKLNNSRSDSCQVTVGNLPFQAPQPHLVSFGPYLDMFDRPLKSLDHPQIGSSIKIFCLEPGWEYTTI